MAQLIHLEDNLKTISFWFEIQFGIYSKHTYFDIVRVNNTKCALAELHSVP